MIKAGIPIVAIDPIGVWWGLRVGVDESKQGLPIVIFGGAHRDLPLPLTSDKHRQSQVDEERLKFLVKSILESGISAVVDTSELSKHLQRRVGAIVCDELFHLNAHYGVRHVFIEEADTLAPQQISGELAYSKGAVDDLVRRGGNFNLGCTLITQRSAVLNKDVLTQCNCLIVLRILHKLDKAAVKGWVESMAAPDSRKVAKWYDSLRDLKNGEAWIWHPETSLFQRIKFRERETLHATREYFRQQGWEQKNIRMLDVEQFVEKFKSIFTPKSRPDTQPLDKGVKKMALTSVPPPVTHTPIVDSVDTVVQQSLPTIEIHQTKPTLRLPVESLNEPTSPLGRTIVALKNDAQASGRQDAWTRKKIKDHVTRHSWPIDGVDEAIDQLIRWEILRVASNSMMRFYPQRVQIVEEASHLEVR